MEVIFASLYMKAIHIINILNIDLLTFLHFLHRKPDILYFEYPDTCWNCL